MAFCGRPAGENEDAGTDDAADAQQHKIDGAQRLLQFAGRVLGVHLLDRFPGEQLPKTTSRHEYPSAAASPRIRKLLAGR